MRQGRKLFGQFVTHQIDAHAGRNPAIRNHLHPVVDARPAGNPLIAQLTPHVFGRSGQCLSHQATIGKAFDPAFRFEGEGKWSKNGVSLLLDTKNVA